MLIVVLQLPDVKRKSEPRLVKRFGGYNPGEMKAASFTIFTAS